VSFSHLRVVYNDPKASYGFTQTGSSCEYTAWTRMDDNKDSTLWTESLFRYHGVAVCILDQNVGITI